MKSIRTLGLCLVAAFALTAVLSTTAYASGTPEFKACIKPEKVEKAFVGKYTSKECTDASKVETGGKYERVEVESGKAFTGKGKAVTLTAAGTLVKCKKELNAGSILAGVVELDTVTFEKCGVNGSSKAPCSTAGQPTGTIKTDELLAEPKWVNSEETQLGIVLFASNETFTVAEFTCGTETFDVKGVLLGTAANTKKGMAFTFALSSGKQAQTAYWEGGTESTNFGEELPFHLYTNPGQAEATLEGVIEQGPKGVGIFA